VLWLRIGEYALRRTHDQAERLKEVALVCGAVLKVREKICDTVGVKKR
jgi:hypothetical protein